LGENLGGTGADPEFTRGAGKAGSKRIKSFKGESAAKKWTKLELTTEEKGKGGGGDLLKTLKTTTRKSHKARWYETISGWKMLETKRGGRGLSPAEGFNRTLKVYREKKKRRIRQPCRDI